MYAAGERSVKKTASMDKKSAQNKTPQSTKRGKPLVLKKSPDAHKGLQSVLGFPCKKPVRLSPTLLPKSYSPVKTPAKIPAKAPPDFDIVTPERKCTPLSSAAKNKSKRFAKSLKDVIEEAKKLQADTYSEKPSLLGEKESQDQESVSMQAKTPKAADFNLPDKYAVLAEFFDAMESAIRLLRLRKAISTFSNICPQVETMTLRRFMHSHVAQMKYILPEGLLLEKIMLHDERTLCMKADLKITLLHDALNSAKGIQVFASLSKVNTSVLRKTFHTRLVEFVQSHPQGDDVPEEVLPEPFNRKCQPAPVKPNIVVSTPSCAPASSPRLAHEQDVQPSIMSSLLPKSFQRRFSQRTLTPQASLNSSCTPEQNQNLKPFDDPEVRKSDSSKSAVSLSANSHFPVGFKNRFAAKFRQNEISQFSNDSKKPSEVDCSPILMSSEDTENNALDQSETPCKVPKAKPVTKNAAEENTPCKSVLEFESESPHMIKGCFSPTTPGVAADSSIQKTVSVISSAHKTPAVKTLLKSSVKSSISRRSLRYENLPNSPDASPPVSSPKTNSFASPDSSRVSKSSGQKSKTSKVRRAMLFNKSNKNSSGSTICEDSSVCSTTLKRKAAEFQSTDTSMLSTPAKFDGIENYADSAMQSPLKMAKNSFPISKNDEYATINSCSFKSPTTTLGLENIQDEKTLEEVFLSTPPLHPAKRRRVNAGEPTAAQIKVAQSCSQTCPPSFQSPEKSNTEHCKVDADRESNASKQTENGSISIQGSCSESLDVINQSEWEILQTLSPKFVREVRERQIKNLDDCRLGVSAAKRRQQMLACLPKLFNMIRDIFRSIKRSVITRQELIHKIISNHCDVTDRSEVEEQLQLLQEFVPDWISERKSTSGDFLYSIENNIDMRSIHTKLLSAL